MVIGTGSSAELRVVFNDANSGGTPVPVTDFDPLEAFVVADSIPQGALVSVSAPPTHTLETEASELLLALRLSLTDEVPCLPPGEARTYEICLNIISGAATVVRFDGAGCSGCPSAMPAMEVDRLKHLDGTDPADCEECGRIVLR